MRSALLSCVVSGLLVMSQSPIPAAAAQGDGASNKAVARRVFDELLNKEKYELFEQIYAKTFVKHVDGKTYSLQEEIQQAKSMRVSMSDLVMTVDFMIAEGDKVVIQYTGRGTSTGPLGGMPPTGKTCVATGATVYRIVGGKIAEEWTYYNMLDILEQLGYMPNPQSGAATKKR